MPATPLNTRLNIRYPLIQAPLAGAQGSALALAVSRAGGLGSLPAAALPPARLREEMQAMRGSGLPWNANFFCHAAPQPDAPRQAAWHALLKPYFDELGLDAAHIPSGPGRQPFDDEAAALVAEFRPPVVSFHFGLPAPQALERIKRAGAFVLSSATTVEEALWLQAHGLEAGGHRGHFLSADLTRQAGLFALLPQIVAAVRVPVIAAGGIATAEGVRAALALGAAGVQAGTAYLCADEAATSPLYRAALLAAAASGQAHTALTTLMTGRPARGLPNRMTRELGPLNPAAPAFPLAAPAAAWLRAAAEKQGRADFLFFWCGENASACRSAPAAHITQALAEGFAAAR